MNKNTSEILEPLEMEIYRDLKESNRFMRRMVLVLVAIIVGLCGAIVGEHIYHEKLWSEYETYYVDSDGYGIASLIGGDNEGGVNNAADCGQEEERKNQGSQGAD